MNGLSVKTTTRSFRGAGIPFDRIAEVILGSRYELSLVICGDTLARRINIESRKKTYAPNVLSFPLARNEGEIFLNVRKAEREARTMEISAKQRIAHLFVHGCYHLKGLKHGNAMDDAEETMLKRFKLASRSQSRR
jgi:rRNA maturation RNase YbeY